MPLPWGLTTYMKISLLFTFLAKDSDEEKLLFHTKELINIIKKQYKDKKYNIVRLVAGLHRNSNRLHTHIAHILEYPDREHVKNWDKKDVIQLIRKSCPDGYDFKVSYYNENDPKYDEEFGLSYCLKEYNSFDQILLREQFENIDDEQLEQLRKYGNDKYEQMNKEHERNERRKQQSENESMDIEQFISSSILDYDYKINKHLLDEQRPFKFLQIKEQYKFIKMWILEYFRIKAEKSGKPILKTFKAINIRDYAINYLAGYEYTNLSELADFLN